MKDRTRNPRRPRRQGEKHKSVSQILNELCRIKKGFLEKYWMEEVDNAVIGIKPDPFQAYADKLVKSITTERKYHIFVKHAKPGECGLCHVEKDVDPVAGLCFKCVEIVEVGAKRIAELAEKMVLDGISSSYHDQYRTGYHFERPA